MKLAIYQADAFTSSLFGGNPAAVCPLASWPEKALMQQIAAENNLSETAFFVPKSEQVFELTWFTPEYEIDLCGHATLATAHIIFTETGYQHNEIHFETPSAVVLKVTREQGRYRMDFPSRPPKKAISPPGLLETLGTEPVEVLESRDLMIVYETEETIKNISPDFRMLKKIGRHVIVTAKGDKVDFVSRFFAPTANIDEDPVTGSAHCTLIPYWAKKLNKTELHALQLSRRQGELFCSHNGDRVFIAGEAVTYLRGEIFV